MHGFALLFTTLLKSGLRKKEIADRLGVTPAYVGRLIKGEVGPSVQLMLDLISVGAERAAELRETTEQIEKLTQSKERNWK